MRLVLSEPTYLKESIIVISELVNEARFKITKNAVELIAMDPANVAMVVFKLLSSCFSEYEVENDTELAINLTNLKQILKRAKANDKIILESSKDGKLMIHLKSNSSRTFSLPILELEEREQKVPELEFPVHIKTPCSFLTESIEDADIVAESVSFIADKDKFIVRAAGDLSHAHIEINKDENTQIISEFEGLVKAKYSIEYLKKMMSGSKISKEVEIHFNQDYPLKLDYNVMDKVSLSFILAPRVEND